MSYSGIAILAFVLNFIINYDILRSIPAKKVAAQSAYRKFLFHVMIFFVADALWGILYEHKLLVSTYIDTIIYFVSMTLTILYWTRYVGEYIDNKSRFVKIIRYAGNVFFVYEISALIMNLFCPIVFWLDGTGYHAGAGRYFSLAFQILMFAGTSIYMFYCSYKESGAKRYRYRAIGAFGLAMSFFLYMQALHPLLPFYSIGCLIGGCLLHTFVVEDERNEYVVGLEALTQKDYMQRLEINSEKLKARTDPLTGAKNKLAYLEEEKKINDDIANGALEKLLVIVCDLNNLKMVNDTKGHDAGDDYLKTAYRTIEKCFAGIPIYRIGGDEFAVLLKKNDFHRKNYLLKEFSKSQNTIAFGASEYISGNDRYFQDIFKRADKNMYDMKRAICRKSADNSDNSDETTVKQLDAEMFAEIQKKNYIVENLDKAIKEKWICAYFQPIVRASNGRVCSEEGLARWNDPEYGFISPGEFIPALEEERTIYKLDLYVLECILEKMNDFKKNGFDYVQHSVNLSRIDFETCDIVEEIRKRVDSAGVPRNMIAVEITESVIGQNFDFINGKIRQFKELGFSVWMDDFGSGYSSLDILERVPFDLIKFDMRFMQQFDVGEKGKIILTELMKMAIGISTETICEGVEKKDQAEFLKEIGCSKLQGFYFEKPISAKQIKEKYKKGIQIGFENRDESPYYNVIGSINLYDMALISSSDDQKSHQYFNTIPMAIVEYKDDVVTLVRSNPSFRAFVKQFMPSWVGTDGNISNISNENNESRLIESAIRECCRQKTNSIFDQKISSNATAHTMVKWIASNDVKHCDAAAIAVLAVTNDDLETVYANIARALAADYFNLFYVNTKTDSFIEYISSNGEGKIALEQHGENFFETSRKDSLKYIYEPDREHFLSIFTKENVLNTIQQQGAFLTTYRYMQDGSPIHVTMKATRMNFDDHHIIIGVGNIDTQMQKKENLECLKREKTFYSRITALAGNYICTYTVDPVTDHYVEYSSDSRYRKLGLASEGDDFFEVSAKEGMRVIHPADLEYYLKEFNKENVISKIKKNGIFKMSYRLYKDGEALPVTLRAAMVSEDDGEKMIVGIRADQDAAAGTQ